MVIAPRLIAEYQALKTGLPADLLLLMQVGAFMQVPGLPGYRLIVQRGNRWDVRSTAVARRHRASPARLDHRDRRAAGSAARAAHRLD